MYEANIHKEIIIIIHWLEKETEKKENTTTTKVNNVSLIGFWYRFFVFFSWVVFFVWTNIIYNFSFFGFCFALQILMKCFRCCNLLAFWAWSERSHMVLVKTEFSTIFIVRVCVKMHWGIRASMHLKRALLNSFFFCSFFIRSFFIHESRDFLSKIR